jgi:hypothetical protein
MRRQLKFKDGSPVVVPTGNVKQMLKPTMSAVKRLIHPTRPYSHEEFIASYSDAFKRRRYEAAAGSLKQQPLDRKDANVDAFLKVEKLGRNKVPRVISPRSYRYGYSVGRHLKKYEHSLFKTLRQLFKEPVVYKGMNYRKQGNLTARKWGRFRRPVAFMIDVARLDQHVNEWLLAYEHAMWMCFATQEHRAELRKLLSWQLVNRISWKVDGYRIRYRIRGSRMSGDMNTGSGNCWIMCAAIHSYMESVGLSVDEYALMNNGDDAVIILESDDQSRVEGLVPFFRRLGLILEMEGPVRELEHIEFCQTHPVFDGVGYTMVRNHHTFLLKDRLLLQATIRKNDWLYSVGKCGAAASSGVPVHSAWYRWLSGVRGRFVNIRGGLARGSKGLCAVERAISPAARVSYWRAFGVCPYTQTQLERKFSALEAGG